MFNTSRNFEQGATIGGNVSDSCYEQTSTFLDFGDLERLSWSPCLDENPTHPSRLQMPNAGGLRSKRPSEGVVEGALTLLPVSPVVVQLSPEVDFPELHLGSEWRSEAPLEVGLDPAEDFTAFLETILDPGAEIDWKNQGDQESNLVEPPVTQLQCETLTAAWLTDTNVTISREHLMFPGLIPEEDFFESEEQHQQVSYNTAIPTAVESSLLDGEDSDYAPTATHGSNQQTPASKSPKRVRLGVKPGTEDYKRKREQNNVSVRKSREKARKKQQQTLERVETLVAENNRLQERVDSLAKEITILKGLFSNIGAAVPPEVASFL